MSPPLSCPVVRSLRLGKSVSYDFGLRLMEAMRRFVAEKSEHYLLLLEHSPVYTVGIREHQYTAEEEGRLRATGADFHRTSRGGLITFHGPGQLVAYPILGLRNFPFPSDSDPSKTSPLGAKRYVTALEETLIKTCQDGFGVQKVGRCEHTGVWVNPSDVQNRRKIAAIGVAINGAITSHGIALNCNTDLAWFDNIVACGIRDARTTSLSLETGRDVTVDETARRFEQAFANAFHCDVKQDQIERIPVFSEVLARQTCGQQ